MSMAAALLSSAAWAGFSFDASGYGAGEELSDDKGAAGGSWRFGADVERPAGDGLGGVRFNDSSDFGFAADAAPEGPSAAYDYEFSCESLMHAAPDDVPEGRLAAIVPAQFDEGGTGFFVLGDGGWHAVRCDGDAVAAGARISCRFELREFGGVRLVSYLAAAGGEWARLSTEAGRTWFRAGASASAVRVSRFDGEGSLNAISGAETEGEDRRVLRWTGGGEGDWSDGGNWSLADGGAADVSSTESMLSFTGAIGTSPRYGIGLFIPFGPAFVILALKNSVTASSRTSVRISLLFLSISLSSMSKYRFRTARRDMMCDSIAPFAMSSFLLSSLAARYVSHVVGGVKTTRRLDSCSP